jgi:hypothetical protein
MNDLRKDDGGPAFPRATGQDGGWESAPLGMSLRDYFAAKAMAALLPSFSSGILTLKSGEPVREKDVAEQAYAFADAMLKERANERSPHSLF